MSQVLQTPEDIRDARSKNGFRMEQSLWASKADYTFLTISAPLESWSLLPTGISQRAIMHASATFDVEADAERGTTEVRRTLQSLVLEDSSKCRIF